MKKMLGESVFFGKKEVSLLNLKVKQFVEIEEFGSYDNLNYYTVRKEDEGESETLKFIAKFRHDPNWGTHLGEIFRFLKLMGERGARRTDFRFEKGCEAFPSRALFGTDLRLYCIRMRDDIVILGGGDVKTAKTVQDCPRCYPHFVFMNKVAKALDEAMKGKEIYYRPPYYLEGDLELFV